MLIPTLKDVMTKNVVSVKPDTPITQALHLLAEYDISGLPVVDDDDNIVGILTEKDVLPLLFVESGDDEKTVSDFMTQPAIVFDQDESFLDVGAFLGQHSFRRVPITADGKLVGVISTKDVLEFILRLRGIVPASAYKRTRLPTSE
jgi:CBS domain-containing protein